MCTYFTSTKKILLIMIIYAALLLSAGCAKIPDSQTPAFDEPIFCGFYTDGSGPFSSYASLAEQWPHIQEIFPLWYYIRADGTIAEDIDQKALELAREKNIKVIPLVVFAANRSSIILIEPAARQRVVQDLIRIMHENGYDGINIDMEIVKGAGGDYAPEKNGLTQFIGELGEEMKPLGKRLDVCLVPPVQPPVNLAPIYDYGALCGLVDRAVIMAYDRHQGGTPPGPGAPLPWVEDNIEATLAAGFLPRQLSLGIPGYGYDWPPESTACRVAAMKDVADLMSQKSLTPGWDNEAKTPYLAYADREIWFENDRSIKEKINLVQKYRLAGCSLWRLGYEDSSFWLVLDSLKAGL